MYTTIFFDLDDTLYPASSGMWDAIRERIDLYIHLRLNISWDVIPSLRHHLFSTYGTTMRGLQADYQINEEDFLAFVHDVPLNKYLHPNLFIRKILQKYPQKKVIFTNADTNHARRVTRFLGIEDCFDLIVDIKAIAPYCKPMPESFKIAMSNAGEIDPAKCVMIDDLLSNLSAAHSLGLFPIKVGRQHNDGNGYACVDSIIDLPEVLSPGRFQG
jgi:putative hydrolase of the HAD superfamily